MNDIYLLLLITLRFPVKSHDYYAEQNSALLAFA